MTEWVTVAKEGEIEPGRVKLAQVGGRQLAICNVNGAYYAIDDVCTHDGGSLDQGELLDDQIECPRHGARFDVRSGRATALPAVFPVATHEVREQGGEVQVLVR